MKHKIRSLASGQRGSSSIEATIIFPVIIIILIVMLFLSLFVYERVFLYYTASLATERAAYVWDNSQKDPKTGEIISDSDKDFDWLYWRTISNAYFRWVNFFGFDGSVTVDVKEAGKSGFFTSLTEKKLKKALAPENSFSGTMTSNVAIKHEISAELQSMILMPEFAKSLIGSDTPVAEAKACVVEPAEFIRLIRLISKYGSELTSKTSLGESEESILNMSR
jgi:hypothetical protein